MLNLVTIIALTVVSCGPFSENEDHWTIENQVENAIQYAVPITQMDGYERYLNDPTFDLQVQRVA